MAIAPSPALANAPVHKLRLIALSLLIACLLLFGLDALLFRTGLYMSVLEPDSTAGLLELILRREKAAQAKAGDNLVVTLGNSRMGYVPKGVDLRPRQTGYIVRTAVVPGSDARSWYYLLRDLDPKVQIAAIETTGLLLNKSALPDLVDVLNHTRDAKVRRAALTSIAMLPAESSREIYARYIADKDEKMRAAAAEGYARLKNPADLPMIEKAYQDEGKTSPRLSLAFAQVMLGKTEVSEFSPLQYLVDTLNSAAYHGVAFPFLVELARDPAVRKSLYTPLLQGTRDEKINLARVMARSGDASDAPQLEKLSHDADPEAAQEGLRALRNLQARL